MARKQWRPFEEARELVRGLGLENAAAYRVGIAMPF